MSERKIILGSTLTAIANAIRSKLGTTRTYKPSEMAEAINGISTGTDVSDTTATAGDVVSGKDFYDASGTKTQGSLAITNITPANSNPPSVASGKNYKPSSNGYLISSYASKALYASADGTQASAGWNYIMSGSYVYAPKPTDKNYGAISCSWSLYNQTVNGRQIYRSNGISIFDEKSGTSNSGTQTFTFTKNYSGTVKYYCHASGGNPSRATLSITLSNGTTICSGVGGTAFSGSAEISVQAGDTITIKTSSTTAAYLQTIYIAF